MSFESIVTGIRAASFNLEVIGNNVSNAGTVAFKQSRANFAGVIQQALLGSGSGPETGVAINGTTHAFSQGGIKVTENPLDLAINGNGFLTLRDASNNTFYSRAGDLDLDADGFLVSKSGYQVQAFLPAANGTISDVVGSLRVSDVSGPPAATANVSIGANLDSRALVPSVAWPATVSATTPVTTGMYNSSTTTTIFDSLGNQHKLDVYFIKGAAANTWKVRAVINGTTELGTGTDVTFTANGEIQNPTGTPTPPPTFPVTFPSWTPSAPAGAAAQVIKLDFEPLTQFSGRFAVSNLVQDGYTTGQLTGLKVDKEGIVKAQLSNGQSVLLGQVALAKFRNNTALEPAGSNLWSASPASGVPQLGTPGSDGMGLVESGALEESNVDVTEQLVEMITAQRNFQASVKALQTQDTITQTVINLR